MLFFIDSFERVFGHAGTAVPCRFSACLREKIERMKESEREEMRNSDGKKRRGRNERRENGESARCKIKDGGNLIEIVAIITHSGAAVV